MRHIHNILRHHFSVPFAFRVMSAGLPATVPLQATGDRWNCWLITHDLSHSVGDKSAHSTKGNRNLQCYAIGLHFDLSQKAEKRAKGAS